MGTVSKFPLSKGGGAEGAGVVLRGRKAKRTMCNSIYGASLIRFSSISKTTPGRLRDRCRYAAAPFV
jgi:hypothetical protein